MSYEQLRDAFARIYRFEHVQAIIVAIDQYAKKALGNREFFLNKPYGIGGVRRRGDVP